MLCLSNFGSAASAPIIIVERSAGIWCLGTIQMLTKDSHHSHHELFTNNNTTSSSSNIICLTASACYIDMTCNRSVTK